MSERQQRADAELPFEAEPDVNGDAEHREPDGDGAVLGKLLADLAGNAFAGVDARTRIELGNRRPELGNDLVRRALRSLRLGQPHLIRLLVAKRLDARVADAELVDPRTKLVDMHRLGELDPDD